MITGVADGAYSTKFNCPGCGSPLEMSEGTISFRCSFCGLVMRVGTPGRVLKYYYECGLDDFALKFAVERHFKEKNQSLNFRQAKHQLFYLPFYRFRGMTYSLLTEKVFEGDVDANQTPLPPKIVIHQRCRNFDLTIPAFSEEAFGLDTLGVRPEVMPLNAFTNETLFMEVTPVDITFSLDEARQQALAMFSLNLGFATEGKECLTSEIIGELLSIIYYPVWSYGLKMEDGEYTLFIDGLAKRVINEIPGPFEYKPTGRNQFQGELLTPISHKCPNCGGDLPVSESSLIYYCSNCRRSYIINKDSYEYITTQSAIYDPADGHYPFWRFPFSACQGTNTVGEFARILTGEIPLIAKSKAASQFYLYVPAFKIADLDILTQYGLRICRIQPILKFGADEIKPQSDMILPQGDALRLAGFYWLAIRSKYKYLSDNKYDFSAEKAGPGELIWLTMPTFSAGYQIAEKGQAQLNV